MKILFELFAEKVLELFFSCFISKVNEKKFSEGKKVEKSVYCIIVIQRDFALLEG